MRVFRRVASQRLVGDTTDLVISHCPLPAGSKLNAVHLDVQLIGALATILIGPAYGLSGFVVPVPEPDTPLSIDTLWDNVIPKDLALGVGSEDLDTESAVTTPEYEMGLVEPGAIIDGGTRPIEIFRRRKTITCARSRWAIADNTSFRPTDEFTSKINRRVRVSVPSMVLFAVSSPSGDNTTNTVNSTPNTGEWSTMRFVTVALENAFIHLLNFVETGAESPYDTMAAIIADFLEPTVMEDTAGAWVANTWVVFAHSTYDITVPGEFDKQTLSSEA